MARIERAASDFDERLVQVNRVAKVVKGGRRFNFSSVVVVGDGRGTVGAGTGKASEVPESIRKAGEDAKKHMIRVPMVGSTIPHEVKVSYGASTVLLKPASPGTGVIAGGGVRAVLEAAGVKDVLSKSLGNNNPVNVVRATILALSRLRSAQDEATRRGKTLEEMNRRQVLRAIRLASGESAVQPTVSATVPTSDRERERTARGDRGRGTSSTQGRGERRG